MWYSIVLIPDRCLSIYWENNFWKLFSLVHRGYAKKIGGLEPSVVTNTESRLVGGKVFISVIDCPRENLCCLNGQSRLNKKQHLDLRVIYIKSDNKSHKI